MAHCSGLYDIYKRALQVVLLDCACVQILEVSMGGYFNGGGPDLIHKTRMVLSSEDSEQLTVFGAISRLSPGVPCIDRVGGCSSLSRLLDLSAPLDSASKSGYWILV